MKVKELKEILMRHTYQDDEEVQVVLSRPSIGSVATSVVKGARFGIDWDRGLLLSTKERLVEKENKQDIYEQAHDLLMFIATEALTKKRHTYEHRTAIRILMRNGLTEENLNKYVSLFHRDKPIVSKVASTTPIGG